MSCKPASAIPGRERVPPAGLVVVEDCVQVRVLSAKVRMMPWPVYEMFCNGCMHGSFAARRQ